MSLSVYEGFDISSLNGLDGWTGGMTPNWIKYIGRAGKGAAAGVIAKVTGKKPAPAPAPVSAPVQETAPSVAPSVQMQEAPAPGLLDKVPGGIYTVGAAGAAVVVGLVLLLKKKK